MKRVILFISVMAAFTLSVSAQKLVRGERMPEYYVKEWISASRPQNGRATIVEFFHSENKVSVQRLENLDVLAKAYPDALNVVVVTREDADNVREMLSGKSFSCAIDDGGKTFSAFSVMYVPYAVISDKRGRVVWVGNPSSLTNAEIAELIN